MPEVPVLDQIRTYWEAVDEALPETPRTPSISPEGSTLRHRWAWAIAAAAAVVVLVGALPYFAWTLRGNPTSDVGSERDQATTTTAPSDIVNGNQSFVVETETLGPLRWTRFETPDKDTPVRVAVDPDGGYVAYQWSDIVMHSDNGMTWRILSEAEAAHALARIDQSYEPARPATLPGRVGTPGEGSVSEANFGYVAHDIDVGVPSRTWISADGYEWEMVESPPSLGDTYGFVGGGSHGGVGDLIYWSEAAARGSVLWIGRFEQ